MPLSAERLKRELADLGRLPTISGVVRTIVALADGDQIGAKEIGAVIARDQVLSARVLRMVNSPFYGFPGRISSVSHAVVLLGLNTVKGLALSSSVFENLADEMQGLWEHSLGTALLSRRLARELKLPDPDEVMVAGLLHDLGKVVLSHLTPEDYCAALARAREDRRHIGACERAIFGYDHAETNRLLAESWRLPLHLRQVLVHHHAPAEAKSHGESVAVVHLADILARGMNYGDGGDPVLPPIDHDAFRRLGLSFAQLDGVLAGAECEYQAGVDVFQGSASP